MQRPPIDILDTSNMSTSFSISLVGSSVNCSLISGVEPPCLELGLPKAIDVGMVDGIASSSSSSSIQYISHDSILPSPTTTILRDEAAVQPLSPLPSSSHSTPPSSHLFNFDELYRVLISLGVCLGLTNSNIIPLNTFVASFLLSSAIRLSSK